MATFHNQATLSYNGNTTTSNITTGEILEVLSATKTALRDSYTSNDSVTYIISIINSGTTVFTGLNVTDNLGEVNTFIIQNLGNTPANATDSVAITDTFNPILNPITVAFNGKAWNATTEYTYNNLTGAFATVPGQITVPAATYSQDAATGAWTVNPGTSVLTVTGTV